MEPTYFSWLSLVLHSPLLVIIFLDTNRLSVVGQQAHMIQPTHSQDQDQDHEDICLTETFRANCRNANEVVVMETAYYGRMRIQSRCVQRDYGYIGCSNDVIGLADVLCSGRRSCHVVIPHGEFETAAAATCPRDFKMYLEASYRCQTVVTAADSSVPCQSSAVHRLTAREGHIASTTTDATGHGSAQCPWLIQGRPGHRINITLWDFAAERQRGVTASPSLPSAAATALSTCRAYAVIREQSPARSITICSEGRRTHQVYTSSSESVEIRILSAGFDKDHRSRHFILHYEIYGCPEFDSGSNTDQWHRRNGNRMEVGCSSSDATWWLECNGFEWVGPSINCSSAGDSAFKMKLFNNQLPSATTSLVAMAVIAVVLSALIVAGGLVILTCRRRSASRAAEQDHQEVYYRQGIKGLPPSSLDHCNSSQSAQPFTSLPLDQQRRPEFYNTTATMVNYPLLLQQPENEYSYIADLQLQQPPPHQPPASTSGGHVLSTGGWRCDPNTAVFNACVTPSSSLSAAAAAAADGVNLSRPVAVIPGLTRDDRFRLPQRSALKAAAGQYHLKSELSCDADENISAMSDCATIAVRGMAPPNPAKTSCSTMMGNGNGNGTDYQSAAV